MTAMRARGFTGWHMLAIMLAFFGTIIAVNVTMAWLANSSWSGMLSANTYVASQDFNRNATRAREWAREGFGGVVTLGDGEVRYRLKGPADMLADVDHVEAIFHHRVRVVPVADVAHRDALVGFLRGFIHALRHDQHIAHRQFHFAGAD